MRKRRSSSQFDGSDRSWAAVSAPSQVSIKVKRASMGVVGVCRRNPNRTAGNRSGPHGQWRRQREKFKKDLKKLTRIVSEEDRRVAAKTNKARRGEFKFGNFLCLKCYFLI
eukprot:Gb_08944 [translate_table: standard]